MKSKKMIIIGIILAILILLVPIPMRLKDGGSIKYKALLYSITKVHRFNIESETGYENGIEIEILGMQIYNNVKTEKQDINTGNNEGSYFFGRVIESTATYIIVEPNENEEERKSSDKISIGLGENNDALYMIGTNVKITYDGTIMETYPAKVKAIKIEIKSAENFEIIFSDKKPTDSYKTYTILSKNETDKYDYNIYGYNGIVNIKIDGKDYLLKDALLENKITMEEIIQKANKDLDDNKITGDMYKDGGSMEYHYENYTIIKCHTLDGNRDVYIGAKEMTLNDVR